MRAEGDSQRQVREDVTAATARAVAVVLVAWNRVAPYKYTEKRGV